MNLMDYLDTRETNGITDYGTLLRQITQMTDQLTTAQKDNSIDPVNARLMLTRAMRAQKANNT